MFVYTYVWTDLTPELKIAIVVAIACAYAYVHMNVHIHMHMHMRMHIVICICMHVHMRMHMSIMSSKAIGARPSSKYSLRDFKFRKIQANSRIIAFKKEGSPGAALLARGAGHEV